MVLILCCGFAGCAGNAPPGRIPAGTVVYPQPPDEARIQYLFSMSGAGDFTDNDSFWSAILGSAATEELLKPYGVDLHAGNIYVCDTKLNDIFRFDFINHTYSRVTPGGYGLLREPVNCCFDGEGNLYVADLQRRAVLIFDADGSLRHTVDAGQGSKPVDVAVANGKLFVLDLERHCVFVYALPELGLLTVFPDTTGHTDERLFSATNLTAHGGNLYITDVGDPGVKVFSEDGAFVRRFGERGKLLGQFVRPKGIAVDSTGVIYVVDAAFSNVQMFTQEGELLMFFGSGDGGEAALSLPAKIRIAYDGLEPFRRYVDPRFELDYLILITNQWGADKLTVFGRISPRVTDAAGEQNGENSEESDDAEE
ncbi:MAG: hypothetical protein JXA28_05340 [Bacteroidetes bacterium]|nr:hypothetical protein [Bacteroidota bacterium]